MRSARPVVVAVGIVLLRAAMAAAQAAPSADAPARAPDVKFVPTPDDVIKAMLNAAAVNTNSVVYDLGCGDGRIVIAAARDFGAHGVGIDIDPQRIREANENAKRAGVADRVKFIVGDLFTASIHDATVVTLYLLPELNLKLLPKLLSELKPGTPIVSHRWDMGGWPPDRKLNVGGRMVYLWHVGRMGS